MPELIENGYIYIAQPPLYKVKKGKQERYIQDNDEMAQYEVDIALEGAGLYVSEDAPALSGVALESLIGQYNDVQKRFERLVRRYPLPLLNELIYTPALSAELVKDQTKMTAWVEQFVNALVSKETSGNFYRGNLFFNAERQIYEPEVIVTTHGMDTTYRIDFNFISSQEYQSIVALGEQLNDLITPTAYVMRGERRQAISSFAEALDWLVKESRKGLTIQRYKGLGEMNPEQLWETTMDPVSRKMLQVNITDAIAADKLFSTLMGDEVEPRRDFIESTALYAQLDI